MKEEELKALLYDIDKNRTDLKKIHNLIIEYSIEDYERVLTLTSNAMTIDALIKLCK